MLNECHNKDTPNIVGLHSGRRQVIAKMMFMMPKLFKWMIRNEWVQSLANKIVRGWVKFCKYEMKLGLK